VILKGVLQRLVLLDRRGSDGTLVSNARRSISRRFEACFRFLCPILVVITADIMLVIAVQPLHVVNAP
jgi:hypothetical protein